MERRMALRLVGVCGRSLRKKSLLVTIVLLFSITLLHIASEAPRLGVEEVNEGDMTEVLDEDDMITPEMIMEMLQSLQSGVSSVETRCRRMARMGGKVTCSCERKACSVDGAKLVCLDDDVRPVPGDCFALNFGIGFEMTFDEALVNYGCRVIALDPTNGNITNMAYDANITNSLQPLNMASKANSRRVFHALNLGLNDKDTTLAINVTFDSVHFSLNVASYYTYQTILSVLDNPRVDLLKIDIEGAEWKVLQQVLRSPSAPQLLQHVRQILLEIHFDFLHSHVDADGLTNGTRITLGVLQRLRNLGFHLTAYELNENAQRYFSFGDLVIPLYRELTLIRRSPHRTSPS